MNFRHFAQPPLRFIPPNANRWVIRLAYAALPILLKVRLRPWLPAGIQAVQVNNADTLTQLFDQFQRRKIRLLIAFRHVEVDDPLCMGYMFSHVVSSAARQQNITLNGPIHSHFMYDRGMSLWAGAWLKGFFAWMGGIPVRRGRSMDLKAIKSARDILINGQFPLTIAPEGATNGHSDILSPLEPGVAQMAFWGVQDLRRQNRDETVVVLPVYIRYRYVSPDWSRLEQLLTELERDCGLDVPEAPPTVSTVSSSDSVAPNTRPDLENCYQRLVRIGTKMLAHTEQVYRQFYQAPLADPIDVATVAEEAIASDRSPNSAPDRSPNSASDRTPDLAPDLGEGHAEINGAIAQHLQPLLDEMLKVGERYFGLSSAGDLPTRCRRLEEAGWTRIYREDLGPKNGDDNEVLSHISPMERGFADRIAAESQLQMEHMRLVESMVAVTGHYVRDNPSFERFAETSLLLFDVMQRIKGVQVPRRPRLGWRNAEITIGNPLSVSDRWEDYAQSRKAGKQAIDALTYDIQQELERLMGLDTTEKSSSRK